MLSYAINSSFYFLPWQRGVIWNEELRSIAPNAFASDTIAGSIEFLVPFQLLIHCYVLHFSCSCAQFCEISQDPF